MLVLPQPLWRDVCRVRYGVGLLVLLLVVLWAPAGMAERQVVAATGYAPLGGMERASLNFDGGEGNNDSYQPVVTADGRYVIFQSAADNLVLGDTNGVQDIFLYDRREHVIRRLTMGLGGAQTDGDSRRPAVSAAGNVVIFESQATNLVEGGGNGYWQTFALDLRRDVVERVSSTAAGTPGNSDSGQAKVSGDGRFVAFASRATDLVSGDTNGRGDVFVYDRSLGKMVRVSMSPAGTQSNGNSFNPAISADGRFVAFQSLASNLLPESNGNFYQVYLFDRITTKLILVSYQAGQVGNDESQRPALSADGRYVAFESWADNLVAGDTNEVSDIFVYDRETGALTLASVSAGGGAASNVSGSAALSADGRYVAFASLADNLVPDDHNYQFDVFLFDRQLERTSLVSRNGAGGVGNGPSISPALSAEGEYVVFDSLASDLVPNDHNARLDVFVLGGAADPIKIQTAFVPLIRR